VALTDTPSSFTGEGDKYVKVNTGATALEFSNITASEVVSVPYGVLTSTNVQDALNEIQTNVDSLSTNFTFIDLDDTPATYNGSAADIVRTNVTNTGLEFHTLTKSDLGLGNVENTALSTWAGSTNITTVGTIGAGTWQGTAIADAYVSGAAYWDSKQDGLTFGIADTNTVVINATDVAALDYAQFTVQGLRGRDTSEVKQDLSLENVANVDITTVTDVSSYGWVLDEDAMSSDDDTKVPTQQSVKAYVDAAVVGIYTHKGSYDAATNTPDLDTSPSGISKGDAYTVSVAGTFFTEAVEIGDVLIADQDSPTLLSHWTRINKNIDVATTTSAGIVELATDGEVAANVAVQGNDSRLSDARTPVAHTHSTSDITSGTFDNARIAESNVTQHVAAIDHGSLAGVSDDDHTMYTRADGTRDFSATVSYASHPTFTSDTELVDKKYVDDEVIASGGYNDESAQDAIGTILLDSSEIDFTYDDGTPSITATLVNSSIDETKLDVSVNASLDLADTSLQSGDNISVLTNDSGYLTGNESITLTGDLSGTGTTSINASLAADTVGVSELNTTGTPDGTKFLRDDMTWVTVSTSESNDLATDGVTGIADDQLVVGTASGTAAYKTLTSGILTYDTTTNNFTSITDSSSNWDAAYTHVSNNGTDHAYIDQDVTSTGTPTFASVDVGNTGLTVGTSVPFSDSSGTLTLQNVDAIDATTESTLEAALDHNSLQGLTTGDPHTQYSLVDGSRDYTAKVAYSAHPTFTADTEIVDKKYVDDAITAGGGYTDEDAQDAVATALTDTSEIAWTYADIAGEITADIVAGSIDETKLDTSVNASLDLADSALQSGDSVSDLTNDAGYLLSTDIDTLAELNAIVGDATLIDTTDSRLSDARTPTAHNHTASEITDFDTEVSNNTSVAANTAKETNVTTNLGYTPSPTDGTVTSSDGTDATLTLATGVNAGLLAPADFTVLSNTSGTNTGDQVVPSDLTDFTEQTAWSVFYSDGAGDVTELALGASGTVLQSNGAAAAPTFETTSSVEALSDLTDIDGLNYTAGNLLVADGTDSYDSGKLETTSLGTDISDMFGIVDGMAFDKPSLSIADVAGDLVLSVTNIAGGDMEFWIGGEKSVLDCDPTAATVTLTEGTDANTPATNYIYVTNSGGTATLQASTTLPTGAFAWIGKVVVPDSVTWGTTGAYAFQRYTEAFINSSRGALSHEREKLRALGAVYINGVNQTLTIDTVASPDSVHLETTTGTIYQLHRQTFPAFTTGPYYYGNGTNIYEQISDLNGVLELVDGTAIADNDRYNLVV